MGVQATVLGASGYSGGELLRLLDGHPTIEVVAAAAHTRAGEPLGDVLPHLADRAPLVSIDEAMALPADVCFSCLPSGILGDRAAGSGANLFVDLADDHRADAGWVYGLTEFARSSLRDATLIANPGCYPTATLLGLVPFSRAGLIEAPVIVDALSGVSGAGRSAQEHLLHATIEGSAGAYGAIPHRHVAEMERGLMAFGNLDVTLSFTPHLVPMTRGLLVTARARMTESMSASEATTVLEGAYANERFVRVIDGWPTTKSVAGSNGAIVAAHVDERSQWLVVSVAIDNLGKGAAGQALQNANVALGIEEWTGLGSIGVWP